MLRYDPHRPAFHFNVRGLGWILGEVDLPNRISNTDFFHIHTIHNNQISYVKRVLDHLSMLFTLFRCLDGGGEL